MLRPIALIKQMMSALKPITGKTIQLMERYPWAMPAFGFISGAASFLMVERKQDQFGQVLAILMLAGWLWLTLERLLQRGISHWFGIEVPPALLRYVTQLVHQESLFFVIPFFFITTSWNSGQMVFTSLLMVAMLISVVDPLYYNWLAPRRWLYFIFHGVTLFAVLSVTLPLIFHLPTPQSYCWALGIAALLSFPGIAKSMTITWWKRAPILVLLLACTYGVGVLVRPWIPPASIWLTQVAITDHVDDANRSPNQKLHVVTTQQLREGLYAYTAIHAPRGLQETIHHVWRHEGKEVDNIALNINGGREEGYRAWTHKLNFPQNPIGKWQIHVVTEAEQVIGILRFEVVESAASSRPPTTVSSESTQEPLTEQPTPEAIPEPSAVDPEISDPESENPAVNDHMENESPAPEAPSSEPEPEVKNSSPE